MDRVRAVLVGCGAISRRWLTDTKDFADLQIVGLVDLRQEIALERAAEVGLSAALTGDDLDAMLAQVRPNVVFNCTVPEAHTEVTLTALRHGCHVLGEKPLADSMENARQMIDVAQRAGKTFAVIQNRRYRAEIRSLRAFLDSGVMGQVTTVNFDYYRGVHFGGFRDHMEHSLLLDMAIHSFDQARFICGQDPVSVYCKEWNPAGSWYDHGAAATAIFQMTDGVVCNYRGSWCADGLKTSWDCKWHIVGEKGSVAWDGATTFQAELVTKSGGFQSEVAEVQVPMVDAGTMVGGHQGNIREFLNAVRSGGTPETICTDNVKSLAMVFGAIKSAEAGCEIKVDAS